MSKVTLEEFLYSKPYDVYGKSLAQLGDLCDNSLQKSSVDHKLQLMNLVAINSVKETVRLMNNGEQIV